MTSAVRETNVFQSKCLEGTPKTPQYDSSVMSEGFQVEGHYSTRLILPRLSPHDAERRETLGKLHVVPRLGLRTNLCMEQRHNRNILWKGVGMSTEAFSSVFSSIKPNKQIVFTLPCPN